MVEFYGTNPATTARYAEDEQARQRAGELRMQEEAFRQRYATERGVAVDAAVRRGLGGGLGGTIADGGQPQAKPRLQQPPAGIGRPVAAPQPQAQPQAQAGSRDANLMRELTSTAGGGALALQQHEQQRQREDALEDKAIEAVIAGNWQLASTLMMQATGKDLPPWMKTEQARNRISAAHSFAIELYPTNIEQRRKFFEAYLIDHGKALNDFPGEAVAPAGSQQNYLWDKKYKMWLSLYPGDQAGALEYAAGRKQIPDAQLREMAYSHAVKMIEKPMIPGTEEDAVYEQRVQEKAEEIYRTLQSGFGFEQQQAPVANVGGSRVDPRGLSGARDQVGSRDVQQPTPQPGVDPGGPPGGVVQPGAVPAGAGQNIPDPSAGQSSLVPPQQGQRQPYQVEGADVKAWREHRGGAPAVMDGGDDGRGPVGSSPENPFTPQTQQELREAPTGTHMIVNGKPWIQP